MQRLFLGLAIASLTLATSFARADDQASAAPAANQQLADQIRSNLKNSGQLQHYSIDVKVAGGTCWLAGTRPQSSAVDGGSEHRRRNARHRKGRQRLEDDRSDVEPGRAGVCWSAGRYVGATGDRHCARATGRPSMLRSSRSRTRPASASAGDGPCSTDAGLRSRSRTERHGRRHEWRTDSGLRPGRRRRSRPGSFRSSEHARLRVAELRRVSELRGHHVSASVFADRVAVHWAVLSVSASPAGLAEGDARMAQRLVESRLQGWLQLMPAGECECLSLIPPTPGGTRRQGFFCMRDRNARNRKRASLSAA